MSSLRRGPETGLTMRLLIHSVLVAVLTMLTLSVGDAWAQSSVRPPDNAVNVDNAAEVLKPGGSVRPPANAVTNAPTAPGQGRPLDVVEGPGATPGQSRLDQRGVNSLTSLWGLIRHGAEATVSIPNKLAATLVQDTGMTWLEWRAKGGPLQKYGGYALAGMLIFLALFYLLRGRIRIEGGRSGIYIERFKSIERFGHWLLGGSFIVLALTGLNLLYGKDYLMPLIGKEIFASITLAGKWAHNNVAWAFMAGLILVFVMWVAHNIPSRIDLVWLAKGGGLFTKGVHPPSRKFNAGQKLIFWATILLGASVSLSGISLLFPYELPLFAETFRILNSLGAEAVLGFALPTELTPMQEMQYAQIWHAIASLAMIVIIIAHIYIGSLGMEGAFSAMGSGMVDRQWAEEHHDLWVEEADAAATEKALGSGSSSAATPAE